VKPNRYGIPDFEPIFDRKQRGDLLDPLEEFIFENEPAGEPATTNFCEQLAALIAFLTSNDGSNK
jgi:hypothetical protein